MWGVDGININKRVFLSTFMYENEAHEKVHVKKLIVSFFVS